MLLSRQPLCTLGLLAVLCALHPASPLSAQDLSGHWQGELVRGMNERFVIDMELVVRAGRISGSSHITFPFHEAHYADMAIEGESHGGRHVLQEARIMAQGGTGYRWVAQGGALRLDTNGVHWRLYGEWGPPGCEPGQVMLFRQQPEEHTKPDEPPAPVVIPERVEGRKVHWAGTMKVREESVLLWLYDDLRYDGDTVSVFVNGQCVAHRIEVPHRKQPRALRVHLQPGTNHLVMHAENEGREAPNTAGMLVRTKGKKHRLVMRSTMNHSAGLVIERDL
jgi:hypothetical protein